MKLKASKTWWVVLAVVAVVVLGAGAVLVPTGKAGNGSTAAVYVAEKKDLKITVLEAGSVKARKSQEIKCQVEGQTTVISLIPEGTIITEEDVKNKRILVELDSADLRDKITQEEIMLQSAQASFTQATESYSIQVKQNESNIKTGELTAKFAGMDLEKYMGADLAARAMFAAKLNSLFSKLDLEKYLGADLAAILMYCTSVSYGALAADKALGGEALQSIRNLQNGIKLVTVELNRAKDKEESSAKLAEKKFVSRVEYEADKLDHKRQGIALEQANTALAIFMKYDFPKNVEQKIADFEEAVKELDRIRAKARSELAKAEADLKSSEAGYRLKKERFDRLNEQLAACIIRATMPGLVVYGTSGDPWHGQPPLEEGSTVREKQVMITLPDTSAMAAEVKVHEAAIDKVKVGQTAKITLDAYPDLRFDGHVVKVAMLPNAQNRWMNPDLKVYDTDIAIDGQHRLLKPGLSAKVEILINELSDVIAVPIQAVVPEGDGHICYVLADGLREKKVVETGEANDQFIEIKSGLAPGQKVLLNPPGYGEEAGPAATATAEAAEPAAANGEPGQARAAGQPAADGKQQRAKRDEPQAPNGAPAGAVTTAEGGDTKPGAAAEQGGEARRQPPKMSAEEREKLRKELESLSPEERQKRVDEMRKQGGGQRRSRDAAGGQGSAGPASGVRAE